jgi:hypothetical protein
MPTAADDATGASGRAAIIGALAKAKRGYEEDETSWRGASCHR